MLGWMFLKTNTIHLQHTRCKQCLHDGIIVKFMFTEDCTPAPFQWRCGWLGVIYQRCCLIGIHYCMLHITTLLHVVARPYRTNTNFFNALLEMPSNLSLYNSTMLVILVMLLHVILYVSQDMTCLCMIFYSMAIRQIKWIVGENNPHFLHFGSHHRIWKLFFSKLLTV